MKIIDIILIIITLYLCYRIYNDYFNFCSYEYYSSILDLINNLKMEEEKKLQAQRDIDINNYINSNNSLKQTFDSTKTEYLRLNNMLTPDLDITKDFIIGNKSIDKYLTIVNSGGINYAMFAYNKETAPTKPECIFQIEKTIITQVGTKTLAVPINSYKIKHKKTGEYLSIPQYGWLPSLFPSFTYQNNNQTTTQTIPSHSGFLRTLPLTSYDSVNLRTNIGGYGYLVDFVFKDIGKENGYLMLKLDTNVDTTCVSNLTIRSGVNFLAPGTMNCDLVAVSANALNFFDVLQIN